MSSGDESSSQPVRALKNERRSIWKGWPDSSFPATLPHVVSEHSGMDRDALAELLQALETRRDAEERRREERYTALIERIGILFQPVELERKVYGPAVEDMIFKVTEQFATEFTIPREITAMNIHQAVSSIPTCDFLTNKYMGILIKDNHPE
ncbi:YETS2 protein, partial [Polyodon spathula]|nr:YETS2 protein [Polyodon spathula]